MTRPDRPDRYKVGRIVDGRCVERRHAPVFRVEGHGAATRIVAGVPAGDPAVFAGLVECLAPPYFLLYVLHTPRGEGGAGRYQSPLLTLDQVRGFLDRFAAFLSADARFDLWAHSPGDDATVVWDRHDLLFAYGQRDRLCRRLEALGFTPGDPDIREPHSHHYHSELDGEARGVLAALDWSCSPLEPADEQ